MEKSKVSAKQVIFGLVMTAALVAFDQVTKWWAVTNLKDQAPIVWIRGVFELQYLENRGAAFGLMQNQRWLFLLSVVVVMIIVGYCFYRLPGDKRYSPLRAICIAMSAGALGNMIDRIANGFVVDFFYFSLIDFPIFNIADIYVTLSAVFLILLVLFFYKEEDFSFLVSKKKKTPGDTDGNH
ncbi:MAG: signal peptidase II [Lachnospiraceae bacterium]|jgi:signal peptidase II|nr:signal peptidase II [Lachnospiraceae bacterium]